jgi:hypothetical protein
MHARTHERTPIYSSICLFVYPSFCRSIYRSVRPSIDRRVDIDRCVCACTHTRAHTHTSRKEWQHAAHDTEINSVQLKTPNAETSEGMATRSKRMQRDAKLPSTLVIHTLFLSQRKQRMQRPSNLLKKHRNALLWN